MSQFVLLDSQPLGLLVHPSRGSEIRDWVLLLKEGGTTPAIPEIVYYELRRELVRRSFQGSLRQLDMLAGTMAYLPVSTTILIRATELWAAARREGRPTADDRSLDVDVILAATALGLVEEGHDVTVATTNVRHLSRFVAAAEWQVIGV